MGASTEDRLRAVLASLAETVEEPPEDAYQRARRAWNRFELRRRAVMVSTALLVVAVACAIGLWALSGASAGQHVIFDDHTRRPGTLFPPGSP
ncbi:MULTISPECIES: hypothetical protein [unclassified Kitasatospora]|uniref:hypothetical protein n=1 Tax=unclassified Kitasatospora TaxID=2633591 RepID=UPI001AE07A4E|nr:hypothetical protein [Kitasatospora sp. RG8]MBP0452913.1 hypothetical protein [Kitasatospora sp. RG8]